MNRLVHIIMSVILGIIGMVEMSGELGKAQANKDRRQVENAKSRPDLNVELENVAQLKIASRKSTFHLGELINLDIALLNSSESAIFFHKLSDPLVKVQSLSGEALKIQPYGVAERTTTPSSFMLIGKNEFDTESFELLAGCDRRAFDQAKSAHKDTLTAFNQNLFLNWGSACLSLTRPGIYVLTVEIQNSYVLNSPRQKGVKTAVGRIKSNSLKITIVD